MLCFTQRAQRFREGRKVFFPAKAQRGKGAKFWFILIIKAFFGFWLSAHLVYMFFASSAKPLRSLRETQNQRNQIYHY